MKLIQYHLPDQGKRVGIVTREEEIVDVTTEESSTVLDLLKLSIEEGVSLGVILADIQEQVSFRNSSSIESRVLASRSEEHTSELQSLVNLVCRLLLEKKKIKKK